MYESLHGYLYRNVFRSFIFVRNNCQSGRILWMVPPLVNIFLFSLFVHRNSHHKVDAFCEGPLIYLFIFFFVICTLNFCP